MTHRPARLAIEPETDEPEAPAVCAHCEGPLPQHSSAQGPPPHFCCYGCRLLGERPKSTNDPSGTAGGQAIFSIVFGAVIASQTMLIGLAINLSEPEGAMRTGLHAVLIALTLGVLGLLGLPLVRATWDCACRRTFGLELLFVSGIIGAFGASLLSSLRGSGPVYYEVVAVLLSVYSVSKVLTARAREQALSETRRLSETFSTARRIGPPEEQVPIDAIAEGDCVRVLPGEHAGQLPAQAVPADDQRRVAVQAHRRQAGWQVLLEDLPIAPILRARRAQAAAAVAAPLVQEHADAACRQCISERLVIARRHAQRRARVQI
jgi:hypothetical protein